MTPSSAGGLATASAFPSATLSSPRSSPAASARLTPTPQPTPSAASAGVPAFRHVYLIVLENREYPSIVDNAAAPYLNSLISHYASLTQMYAETHPSEPNYLALFSGSTQGAVGDGRYDLAGTNLVDQLVAHGRSWRVFAQNIPPGCFIGSSASGGADGPGTYARKHNPAISFTDISGDPSRCADITDLSHFGATAADFELIIPNLCNDMHDCSVKAGDAFLAGFVPGIIDGPEFADSVLFITFDEGVSTAHGGGHVATIVISPLVRAGSADAAVRDHFSLLRTIEDAWGLGCLNATCHESDLRELFGA
ncbi:MAG: alkaline phosphatase family protein [Candidatus Limnocylindrales bacterium]